MKRDKNDRGAWDRSKCQSTNSCRQKKNRSVETERLRWLQPQAACAAGTYSPECCCSAAGVSGVPNSNDSSAAI